MEHWDAWELVASGEAGGMYRGHLRRRFAVAECVIGRERGGTWRWRVVVGFMRGVVVRTGHDVPHVELEAVGLGLTVEEAYEAVKEEARRVGMPKGIVAAAVRAALRGWYE